MQPVFLEMLEQRTTSPMDDRFRNPRRTRGVHDIEGMIKWQFFEFDRISWNQKLLQ